MLELAELHEKGDADKQFLSSLLQCVELVKVISDRERLIKTLNGQRLMSMVQLPRQLCEQLHTVAVLLEDTSAQNEKYGLKEMNKQMDIVSATEILLDMLLIQRNVHAQQRRLLHKKETVVAAVQVAEESAHGVPESIWRLEFFHYLDAYIYKAPLCMESSEAVFVWCRKTLVTFVALKQNESIIICSCTLFFCFGTS